MEANPVVIFERLKAEIELRIQNFLQNELNKDLSQSEELSVLEPEISKVMKLDKQLSKDRDLYVWNELENINLSSKLAYFYFGLVTDHHFKLKDKLLESILTHWQRCEVNYEELIDLINKCSINTLLKLTTIFAFTIKRYKDKLDQAKINQIIYSFQVRLQKNDYNHDYTADMLIRRFFQILKWKDCEGYKFDANFWKLSLDCTVSRTTYHYIFPILEIHLKFGYKNNKAESNDLIHHLLFLLKKLKRVYINEEYFWEHKDWVVFYIQSELENLSNYTIPDKKKQLSISTAISFFLSYIKNISRKNMKYIIENFQLARIFDFAPFSFSIDDDLSKIVELQLGSQFYSTEFLEKYFSCIKIMSDPYEVSKAENMTIKIMLLTCLNIDGKIKNDILDYAENFFRKNYKDVVKSRILTIWLLMLKYLPSAWDRFSAAADEINQSTEGLTNVMLAYRQNFWKKFKQSSNLKLEVNVPDYFMKFIDSLIEYLHAGSEESWNEMSDIVSNWNNGFNINSAEYENNDYWAKVLISYCWSSDHLSSLADFWKNNAKIKNSEQKTKDWRRLAYLLLAKTQL